MRSRLAAVAKHGVVRAANVLAGSDPDAVCVATTAWRHSGERELPWLAGPGLSALGELRVPLPAGQDVQMLERFLVGAESDARSVAAAVEHDARDVDDDAGEVPPDARAALVACAEQYFALLAEAYAELRPHIVAGDRAMVDALCERWQERMDGAAHAVEERGKVVLGLRRPAALDARPPRPVRDHSAWALGFVLVAIMIAGMMLWAVTHGWPMETMDFGI